MVTPSPDPMSTDPTTGHQPLSFDNSTSAPPTAQSCTKCGAALRGTYHLLGESMICGKCRMEMDERMTGGSGANRFLRATIFGIIAGIAGAALYYGFVRATDREWALVTAIVGLMVGKAVHIGSHRRGGRKYQVMAVIVTYFSLSLAYAPFAIEGAAKAGSDEAGTDSAGVASIVTDSSVVRARTDSIDAAARAAVDSFRANASSGDHAALIGIGLVAGVAFLAVLPVLVAFGSPLSALIMAFGLWEAWKMNRGELAVGLTGPFRLGAPTPPPAA